MIKFGQFAITSDEDCVTISKVRTVQSGKNKGKEYLEPRWYYPNFEQAFESLIEKQIMISKSEDLLQTIRKVKEEIIGSIKGLDFEKIRRETKTKKKGPEPKKEPSVSSFCEKHPKYKGLRKPRTGCVTCLRIYNRNKGKQND